MRNLASCFLSVRSVSSVVFVRYQNLKLKQYARLSAYKQMPELETCEREIQKPGVRLVAPNGEAVPTHHFEIVDFGKGDGRDLEVFIGDESVYVRYALKPAKFG